MSKLQLFFFLTSLTVISQTASAQSSDDASSPRWQSCTNSEFDGWFEDQPPPGLLCGYVEAPLIYSADAQSGKVRLALTRLVARGVKKGSIVVVTGGPGLPGINPYISNDKTVAKLRESFDIIGYDPRGVGQSTPKISCGVRAHNEKPTSDKRKIADSEAQARKTIATCIKQTGTKVLQHIGTREAVNDLNVIRTALGELGLTAVAYSYGTQVAALYAEQFPEHTRALVLDGIVDLSEDSYTQQLNQALSFQQTFQRFAAYCAQQSNCPLSNDERRAMDEFHQILRKVNDSPLITRAGHKVTADDLLTSTQMLLLWSERWPDLIALLHKARERIADEQVITLIGQNNGPDTEDAMDVISCADIALPGTDTQVLRRQRQAINAASPYSNFLGEREWPLDICDMWPYQGTLQAHIPVASPLLPPLLFVDQRYDATTPYANAQRMAKWFRSPLITRESDGHTLVLGGVDRCVDEAVVDYLMNPGERTRDKYCRNQREEFRN